MDLHIYLAILLGAFALTGIIFLVFIAWYWKTIGGMIPDFWPKMIVESIQGFSAIASIGAAFATGPDDKSHWLWPAILGCFSVVVWKTLQVLMDSRVRAWEKVEKETQNRLQEEIEAGTRLLTLFRKFVVQKVRRLSKVLRRDATTPGRKTTIRSTLAPDAHLDEILLSIAVYFSSRLPEDQPATGNFRVGLYINESGFMKPLRAVDSNHGDYDVFRSFDAHQDRFSLGSENEKSSHVVQCVRQRKTIIVEDCQSAAGQGKFFYFNEDQKGYLRSMLAYHLGQVYLEDGKMTTAALVIDTNLPGFFREIECDSLEFALREFASRIKLELLLHALLTDRKKKP